jgi:hypothetical protein
VGVAGYLLAPHIKEAIKKYKKGELFMHIAGSTWFRGGAYEKYACR